MLSRRRTRLSAWQSLTDRYCVLRTRLCRGRAAGLRSRLARTPLWRHYGSAEPCGTSRLLSRTPGHVIGVHLRRLFPMIMLYVGLEKAPRVLKAFLEILFGPRSRDRCHARYIGHRLRLAVSGRVDVDRSTSRPYVTGETAFYLTSRAVRVPVETTAAASKAPCCTVPREGPPRERPRPAQGVPVFCIGGALRAAARSLRLYTLA
jgi:hypothetical protein